MLAGTALALIPAKEMNALRILGRESQNHMLTEFYSSRPHWLMFLRYCLLGILWDVNTLTEQSRILLTCKNALFQFLVQFFNYKQAPSPTTSFILPMVIRTVSLSCCYPRRLVKPENACFGLQSTLVLPAVLHKTHQPRLSHSPHVSPPSGA